jgi:hypothetical protein
MVISTLTTKYYLFTLYPKNVGKRRQLFILRLLYLGKLLKLLSAKKFSEVLNISHSMFKFLI